jgi:hypothetical protein
MIYKSAIFSGAVGGIIPNILRLAINLTSDPPKQTVHGWSGYLIGVTLLALLGAVIAWIWQESDLKKALYLGIGLPSLIQVIGLQSAQPGTSLPQIPSRPVTSISLISSAYGQTASPTEEELVIPGRKLTTVSAGAAAPLQTIAFFNRDGRQIGTASITSSTPTVVDVPDSATAFTIQIGESSSQATGLPDIPNATETAEVKIGAAKSSGFLQAFGFSGSNRYDIRVSLTKPLPVTGGFCKFGIQSNTDGTWSERLFDAASPADATGVPAPGTILIAKQDINVRSDFPEHVEGKGLYFRPTIAVLRNGQKVVVKEIRPFKLAKETHYWMQFSPADKP